MANRNITLSMPEELIRRAKIESVKRDLSISALTREALEKELQAGDQEKKALRRFLNLAKKHPVEMPEKLWKREDLYE
jgi:hypothetical protein